MATRIAWRGQAGGTDTCRLSEAPDGGWQLNGHAVFDHEGARADLRYEVTCAPDWDTRQVRVTGHHGSRQVDLHITRDAEGWRVGGAPQPGLEAAWDIDLFFTPATNLMPIRRIGLACAPAITMQAAWLSDLGGTLEPLDQMYIRLPRPGQVRYIAQQTDFEAELTVDASGFVTQYPGQWTGEITDAG